MTAPELHFVPHFAVLQRLHLPNLAVAVYGVIAAYQQRGHAPSISEIAWTAGHRTPRSAQRSIVLLEERRLLRRVRSLGGKNVYELLGPTLDVANDNTQEKTA